MKSTINYDISEKVIDAQIIKISLIYRQINII